MNYFRDYYVRSHDNPIGIALWFVVYFPLAQTVSSSFYLWLMVMIIWAYEIKGDENDR